jgi:hypothetical protein
MYESLAARLTEALRSSFGDAPRWELLPNKTYGFYLYYDGAGVQMDDVRRLIDHTVGFGVGIILAPRNHHAPPDRPTPSAEILTP